MVELTLLKQQQKSVPVYKEYGDLKIEEEQIQEREDLVDYVGLTDLVDICFISLNSHPILGVPIIMFIIQM